MRVRDMFTTAFADKYGDIDVFDDCVEELAVAFCGPLKLTKQGEAMFNLVLDDEVEMGDDCIIVCIDSYPEGVWQQHLKKLKMLFGCAAGFCSESEYTTWFEEV